MYILFQVDSSGKLRSGSNLAITETQVGWGGPREAEMEEGLWYLWYLCNLNFEPATWTCSLNFELRDGFKNFHITSSADSSGEQSQKLR